MREMCAKMSQKIPPKNKDDQKKS